MDIQTDATGLLKYWRKYDDSQGALELLAVSDYQDMYRLELTPPVFPPPQVLNDKKNEYICSKYISIYLSIVAAIHSLNTK